MPNGILAVHLNLMHYKQESVKFGYNSHCTNLPGPVHPLEALAM